MKPSPIPAVFRRPAEPAPMLRIWDHPEIVELDGKIAKFEERLAASVAREKRARKLPTGAAPLKRTAVESAELLAAGGTITSLPPAAEVEAALAEARILQHAIMDLTTQKTEIAGQLSFEANKMFVEQNKLAMLALDENCARVHATLSELRRIQADLQAAGYTPREDVLPTCVPWEVYRLGNPASASSPAATVRAFVRKHFGRA